MDHSVTGTLIRSHKTQEVGPSGRRFRHAPCKIVPLREIKGSDETGGLFAPAPHVFRIDDTRVTRDYLEIEWSVGGDSDNNPETQNYRYFGEFYLSLRSFRK